jgi:hypothetical protein
MSENRVHIPDPNLMRRAGTRITIALIIVLILTTPFTIGGITLLANGELPGLPLAACGAVVQIGCIVVVVFTLRIRRTLNQALQQAKLTPAARSELI